MSQLKYPGEIGILLGLQFFKWKEVYPPFEKGINFNSQVVDLKFKILRQGERDGTNQAFMLLSSQEPEMLLEEMLKLEGSEAILYHLDILRKHLVKV